MEYAVIVRGLTKSYGGVPVLRGINLRVKRGEFLCIVGKNGTGKTTLLNAIAGLVEYSGEVMVNARTVGILGQRPALYPKLTVRENLDVFGRILGVRNVDLDLIEALGLKEYLDKPVEELSHGNVRKAEIVCTLLGDPDLLLLDEPLVSLDYESRVQFIGLLRKFKEEGRTVIAVTHFPEIMCPLCDRTFRIVDGNLKEESCSGLT
ncbi:hypothetical protein A3L09_00510 [Thermococcus profundus]|uniref:ABC transporter domain-containing protein n=1 Tax=Thermococcus profundus TaxID=49899 RepID=A0A2Z2M850_THEPR|nr:ABC transporter ATP-binding protein [Thermococcus profundus]ASJ01846.1 hypothetical protein A3L09_00510 [Thermococcus profundus]